MSKSRNDLIKAVAKDLGKTQVEVSAIVQHFFGKIKDSLSEGEAVQMIGLMSFKVVDKKATVKRNPKTGATVNVPAKKVVKIKGGLFFKL
jgi:DNA-binding protein HU-beta